MKMIRKFGLLSLLLVAILFAQNASATLYLPPSSYAGGAWQGFRYYYEDLGDDDYLWGRIEFAVYDTDTYPNEFVGDGGFEAPGEGQYIYAYQIFNDDPASDEAVGYFSVFAIDGAPLDVDEDSIGSQEDPGGGVEPTKEGFTSSNLEAFWEFDNGVIYKGDHSWLLVFSSNAAPVAGDYKIRAAGKGQLGVSPVPEPGTLTLLGLGATAAFIRRRKSV